MASHFQNLAEIIPNISKLKILDIGSGGGEFLVEAAEHGAEAVGVEKKEANNKRALEHAREKGVTIDVRQAVGEHIPFPDNFFDFANLCELIEHVENPSALLKETYRVLRPGGKAYLSIPNRFGMKDQHFRLYFLNWLPRSLGHWYVGLRGKHKPYTGESGYQRIDQMHYYTLSKILKLVQSVGFTAEDIRLKKIDKRFQNPFVRFIAKFLYALLKHFYFDSFHFLLIKKL
jgi:ubiquinone/menaquinone biosynthesis C-methylase UbiE